MGETPRLPGLFLNQVAWTARLERMAATAIKYGSVEGTAQIEDLAERMDGINQVVSAEDYPLPQISLDEEGRPRGSELAG